jgi:hypothetical protein
MATDATGTPTSPDNIPTYNVSADAPSGLGFNAAMAAIQTALSARVDKPAGIATGEVPLHLRPLQRDAHRSDEPRLGHARCHDVPPRR